MSKILTKGELDRIDRRIEEITVAIALCESPWHDDVLDNLENELRQLVATVEDSLAEIKRGKRMKTKQVDNVIRPKQFQTDGHTAIERTIDNLIATFGKETVFNYMFGKHGLIEIQPTKPSSRKRNAKAV